MQIVIDIPERMMEHILDAEETLQEANDLMRRVARGTPLPEGHGRLIDEKEIDTVVNGIFTSPVKHSPETFLNVIHNQCIEAVGADKTKREE